MRSQHKFGGSAQGRRALIRTLIFCVMLALLTPSVFAAGYLESKTGVTFEELNVFRGSDLKLAGAGARTVAFIKVYAAALYLHPDTLKDLTGKSGEKSVCAAIIKSVHPKLMVTRFVRDVGKERMKSAFKESILKYNPKPDAKFSAAMEQFLNAAGVNLKKKDLFQIYMEGDDTIVIRPDGTETVIKHRALSEAIAGSWLGEKAASSDLRKSLIDRINGL